MAYFLQKLEVVAGRIYTFPQNNHVSLWITDDPFGSRHGGSPYFKIKFKKKMVSVSLPELEVLHTVDKSMKVAVDMAIKFASTRIEILIDRYNDAIEGRIPQPIE